MANREKTSPPEIHCVFVKTSLDTCLALPVNQDEITSDFKDKLCQEHRQVFREIGDINVSALKVKRRRKFYHFSESMNVCKAFDGISGNWFMYADAVRVEKGEVLTVMAADEKHSNLELVEKKKELTIGSVFVDGHTKDLILEEGLETQVVEKKTKKRKIRSSDGKTSRKKSKVDLNQSAVNTTELCGKVQGEVASQSCAVSPREKLDDLLPGAIEQGDQAKSVKSTKKKSSKKAKTPAKEGTLVDSGAQNVEPIKVVDGEGPENIIRNVLDSLQQRNEAEENLDKSGKKSSKRLKKKDSLNIVEEAQEMSVEVNNAAQDEASPINNPKDSDASFTPAKKNTENNASHLNKIIELAHNTEDINRSMQTLKENADMGDTFGSSQKDNIVGGGNKQDQVAGGAKSKKEKKSLDLHPGGSIDGAMKPKERKGRVQPSRSGTSQLQSKDKNDRSGSKVDHSDASMKAALNNKKEAVKKSSNSATVNKSKMNVDNKNTIQYHSLSVICGLPASSVTANKSKMNFFKDAEKWNSAEDKSKTTSHVSTKTRLDISSGDVCDVTSSMSRKQGNNVAGGTNKFSGSLRYNLRSSKSYKAAKLTASQSQ